MPHALHPMAVDRLIHQPPANPMHIGNLVHVPEPPARPNPMAIANLVHAHDVPVQALQPPIPPNPLPWFGPWRIQIGGRFELRLANPCRHCHVVRFKTESTTFCCKNGTAPYTALAPYPDNIWNDVIKDPRISGLSRKLNLIFSFAALRTNYPFPHHGRGPPGFFAVQGRVYHTISPTWENSGFRWFLLDAAMDDYRPWRDDASFNLPGEWINLFRDLLLTQNPLGRQAIHMRDLAPDQRPEVMVIEQNPGTNEISAVMFLNNTARGEPRARSMTIVIPRRNPDGTIQRDPAGNVVIRDNTPIYSDNPLWEPLAYPILFPYGEGGHTHYNMPPGSLSLIWHVRQRVLREARFAYLGHLTGEYLVDMWSRHLESTLKFISSRQLAARGNQGELNNLRQEAQAAMDRDNEDLIPDDQNIYLPKTFVGSRAWCENNVANSLALAATYGQPTLFVMMTCNPEWPEIQAALKPGQDFRAQPVMVCRVFHERLRKLMDDLRNLFPDIGRPIYEIRVIEYQKRGLPHAHILLRYPRDLTSPESINSVISACLPPEEGPDRELVKKFMVHKHPRGDQPKAACQKEKDGERTCRFNFPMALQPATTLDHAGRALYRRINPGDEWVASYNIDLLRRHQCHINIDVANTSLLFQYLFKYVHKMPDYASIAIHDNPGDPNAPFNEAEMFQRGRQLSATEAAWRFMGYDTTHKAPGVSTLAVHLPGQNTIRYGAERGDAGSMSSLLRYFCRPRGRGEVRVINTHNQATYNFDELTYVDFNRYFIAKTLDTVVSPDTPVYEEHGLPERQIGRKYVPRSIPHLSRLPVVRVSRGEPYYLRCLLLARPARSYEELRTVDGVLHDSFQSAATELGLFAHADEAHHALTEAIGMFNTPAMLRSLFADLLLNDAQQPRVLWETFGLVMSRDYTLMARGDEDRGLERTLQSLGMMLAEHGRTLEEFGLPQPEVYDGEVAHHEQLYADRRLPLLDAATARLQAMNQEQRGVFDTVYQAVVDRQPLLLFVDGKAGRGKTYVVAALLERLRGEGKIPVVGASSAFAALLYEGGRTIHSIFKVQVNDGSVDIDSDVQPNSPRADFLRQACCFFWDEAPMANRAVLKCVDNLLRELCQDNRPFGGKPFILLGDFRQCAPVVRGGSRRMIVDASMRSSPTWRHFAQQRLVHPIRNAADPELARQVDDIGDGTGGDGEHMVNLALIPTVGQLDGLIDFVFPPDVRQDAHACLHRSILCATNLQIDKINQHIVDTVQGESMVTFSSDIVKETHGLQEVQDDEEGGGFLPEVQQDFLHSLKPPGLPPHRLEIKVNTIVRLLRNLSQERGLVKNVRLKVVALGRRSITCELIKGVNGVNEEEAILFFIPRITFMAPIAGRPFSLQRKQFPLAPAYATTFNSCQGLTLSRVGLDFSRSPFSHGQLYTAISRVAQRDHARAFYGKDGTEAQNVVYKELLNDIL